VFMFRLQIAGQSDNIKIANKSFKKCGKVQIFEKGCKNCQLGDR
jgi:hypothetical protein